MRIAKKSFTWGNDNKHVFRCRLLLHHHSKDATTKLPEEAHYFLSLAVRTLKLNNEGAGEVIYYYDISMGRKGDDLFNLPIQRAKGIISSAFGNSLRTEIEGKRIVRSVAPRKYHVVLDLRAYVVSLKVIAFVE